MNCRIKYCQIIYFVLGTFKDKHYSVRQDTIKVYTNEMQSPVGYIFPQNWWEIQQGFNKDHVLNLVSKSCSFGKQQTENIMYCNSGAPKEHPKFKFEFKIFLGNDTICVQITIPCCLFILHA